MSIGFFYIPTPFEVAMSLGLGAIFLIFMLGLAYPEHGKPEKPDYGVSWYKEGPIMFGILLFPGIFILCGILYGIHFLIY